MHSDRSIAKKLLYWLKSWYDNRSSSKKLTKPSKLDELNSFIYIIKRHDTQKKSTD